MISHCRYRRLTESHKGVQKRAINVLATFNFLYIIKIIMGGNTILLFIFQNVSSHIQRITSNAENILTEYIII